MDSLLSFFNGHHNIFFYDLYNKLQDKGTLQIFWMYCLNM